MLSILRPLSLVVLLLGLAGPAIAQHPTTSVLGGYGGIDHETSLGPALHVNVRKQLAGWDSVRVSRHMSLPRVELQAELFGQTGRSGTEPRGCSFAAAPCAISADPVRLAGLGLVTHADLSSPRYPVQLYAIPISVGVYVRRYEQHEQRLGTVESSSREALSAGVGYGNGIGVRLRLGQLRALLEMRAVIIHDADGVRGGSLPFSVGIQW